MFKGQLNDIGDFFAKGSFFKQNRHHQRMHKSNSSAVIEAVAQGLHGTYGARFVATRFGTHEKKWVC